MPDKDNTKINIIKPDGRIMQGTREELKNLQILGDYREEGASDLAYRQGEAQTERDYSTTTDKLKTAGMGVISGATLGLVDPLITTDEERLRAKYNPGSRLAGELIGSFGGGATPAGLVTGLAKKAGTLKGVKGVLAAGAIEGAGVGLQVTLSNATLNNDPLTAESLRAGIGYGALFGAGLNATVHGLGVGASKLGSKLEAKPEYEKVYKKLGGEIELVNEDNYRVFHANLKDGMAATNDNLSSEIGSILGQRGAIVDDFARSTDELAKLEKEAARLRKQIEKNANVLDADAIKADKVTAKDVESAGFRPIMDKLKPISDELNMTASTMGIGKEELKAVNISRRKALSAINDKDWEAASVFVEDYRQATSKLADTLGIKADIPEKVVQEARAFERISPEDGILNKRLVELEAAITSKKLDVPSEHLYNSTLKNYDEAIEGLQKVWSAIDQLKYFPGTAKEFTGMGTKKSEKLFEAIDLVLKDETALTEGVRSSLKKSIESLVESTGIKVEGGLLDNLREIKRIGTTANKAEILGPTAIETEILKEPTKSSSGSLIGGGFNESMGALAANKVLGVGYWPAKIALHGVDSLFAIKDFVQTRVSNAAKSVGKAFTSSAKNRVVPKLQPLYTKLDGRRDKEATNSRSAATNRINEFMQMAPGAHNVLYKAVESQIGGQHTDVMTAMHQSAVDGFNAFIELLPKPKNHSVMGLKNTWEASDVEAAITAKLMRVFYTPVDVVEDSLKGKLDPIEITALKSINPEIYNMVRNEVMLQLPNNPHLMSTINNQQALSTLLGISVSSCFSPQNIVEAQKHFVETPSVPQSTGPRNTGGRPSPSGFEEEHATPAQQLWSR